MKELTEDEKKRIFMRRYNILKSISQQMLANSIAFNSQPGASEKLVLGIKKIAEDSSIIPGKFPQKVGELIVQLNLSQYGYNG